ncbi:fibronectin type III domain-containing protein [Bariatricus sp. SGI.019]|uniref:fibronectin type III domain-containing protein n=1 Tax=Bariatricus sp. SGI.019 TaxID=3420548 RepID=UPI003D064672
MRKKKRIASVLIALALIVTAGLSFPGQSGAVRAEEDTDNITIVDANTQWQYRDDNQAPADGWKTSETVTETWKTAAGSFGAKNGVIADFGGGCTPKTLLNQYIEGTSNDIPVYYFRKTFDLEDPTIVQSVTGSLLYDDAVTVYINGVRIAGYDDGSFDENGYGGSNASAPKTGEINFTEIAALNLKGTGNVVSVELHNGRPSSSDVYLDFQSLTFGTAVPEKEVKYISLNIGSDETQRNITWMASSDKEAYVQVATKPEGWVEGNEFPADAVSYTATQTDSAVNGLKSCKATMTDLKENTTYLYRVGNDEKWSDTYSFTTQALGQDQEFSFLFAGDPQIGASGNSAADTTNWQNTMSRSLQAFPQTSFLLSAGDQVNSRDSDTEYEGFLSPDAMRLIPLATNVGNHDNGSERYTSYYNIQDGKAFNPMTGVSAQDYEGNDITELVHVTVYNADTGEQVQYVDTSKTGNYRIVYDVTDTYGKTASAEQLVEVVKNTDENPGQNPDENPSENPDENPGQISGTGSGNGQTDNNGKGNGLATAGTSQSSKETTVKTGDEAPLVLFGVFMLLAAGAAVVVLRRRSIR